MSDWEEDELHVEDPLTGELVEGTIEEETQSYLNMEEKAEESTQNLWMVPFADLMSTLVILFLALFGYAYLGATTGYERAVIELQKELASGKNMTQIERKQKEAELARALEKKLQDQKLKKLAQVDMTAQRIRISLSNPVLFGPGQSILKPAAEETLQAIAQVLNETTNEVRVEGHTDNVPVRTSRFQSNFELSAARAFSVIEFFIKSGVSPARFSAYGYGEFRPVAENATEEGRSKNRRIEINIIRTTEKT